MFRLKGGRFIFTKSAPVSQQETPDEITQIKVMSSEPDKLFEKKALPELHETTQEVDIPFLITELDPK